MTVHPENSISPTVNGGIAFDRERLRFVTENFSDLQGLNRATFGVALLMMNLARLYGNGRFRPIFEVLAIVSVLAAFVSLKYAPRYYRWRFGWIEKQVAPPDWSLKSAVGVVAWVTVFSVAVLTDVFKHLEQKGIDVAPLAVLVAFSLYMSLSRPQLMSLRLPYLFPALLVVAGVTLFPLWYITDDHQLALWRALDRSFLPFVLVVMGFGDHILLLRLLPKRVSEDDDDG